MIFFKESIKNVFAGKVHFLTDFLECAIRIGKPSLDVSNFLCSYVRGGRCFFKIQKEAGQLLFADAAIACKIVHRYLLTDVIRNVLLGTLDSCIGRILDMLPDAKLTYDVTFREHQNNRFIDAVGNQKIGGVGALPRQSGDILEIFCHGRRKITKKTVRALTVERLPRWRNDRKGECVFAERVDGLQNMMLL